MELHFCRTPCALGEGAPLGPRQGQAVSRDELSDVRLGHLLGHALSGVEHFQLLTSCPRAEKMGGGKMARKGLLAALL